jgi:hypothetical protein
MSYPVVDPRVVRNCHDGDGAGAAFAELVFVSVKKAYRVVKYIACCLGVRRDAE